MLLIESKSPLPLYCIFFSANGRIERIVFAAKEEISDFKTTIFINEKWNKHI
jgi:hypothetical protein